MKIEKKHLDNKLVHSVFSTDCSDLPMFNNFGKSIQQQMNDEIYSLLKNTHIIVPENPYRVTDNSKPLYAK